MYAFLLIFFFLKKKKLNISLADLDEMLIAIHDLATHESAYQNKELNKLLAELWTIFGGNKVRKQLFEEI